MTLGTIGARSAAAILLGIAQIAAAADNASPDQGLEKSIPLGPFKITAGVGDSGIGVGLTGGYDHKLYALDGMTGCAGDQFTIRTNCSLAQLELTVSVDAKRESGNNGKNYATLVLQPTFEYELFRTGPAPQPVLDKSHPECFDAAHPEKFLESAACYVTGGGATGVVAFGVYPDLEYRYGHIDVSGTTYQANQLIYGGGARLMYPSLRSEVFATWPFVSVGYSGVHDAGSSNLPVPTGVKNHYLTVQGQLELYVPGTGKLLHAPGNSTVLAKIDGSHAKGGSGWEVARTFQLIVDLGGSFQPAVTYKSGIDRGFDYDHQVLIGVAYALIGRYDSAPSQ